MASYGSFWRVGAKAPPAPQRDSGDAGTEHDMPPPSKRSRAQHVQEVEKKAAEEAAEAEQRRAERQRQIELDAAEGRG